MRALLARLLGRMVADDPSPTLSRLDVLDRRRPLCSVLGCADAPTSSPHGWAVCSTHTPAQAA